MTRKLLSPIFLLYILTTAIACTDSSENHVTDLVEQEENSESADTITFTHSNPTIDSDTTIFYDFNGHPIEVIIKFPENTVFRGTIVALPGWNYPNSGWCEETELCKKALAKGYALILPEMGKSIYCDSVFPETRKDWLKYPTRAWMKETMIPNIQNDFQLLETHQKNFVMGLSTGARGAVLLAMDLPNIFSACGALSGDFDQTRYTKDKLYNGYYGPFQEFQDRWVGSDNAISSISKLTIPVYLAHGKEDKIVPIDYSQQLFLALQESGNEACVLNVNGTAGHDYDFWNSEVDAVLEYFEEHRSE